jgi:hypothetical protein
MDQLGAPAQHREHPVDDRDTVLRAGEAVVADPSRRDRVRRTGVAVDRGDQLDRRLQPRRRGQPLTG